MIKNERPFKDRKYRTIDHPRYHELREAGEFVLEDWRYDMRTEEEAELRQLAVRELEMQDQLRAFASVASERVVY